MSAIKRSESNKTSADGGGQCTKHEPSGGNAPATSKLVFGLNARTNKVKHDEYAEQRLRATAAPSERANSLTKSSPTRAKPSSSATSIAKASKTAMNGMSSLPATSVSGGGARSARESTKKKAQDLTSASSEKALATSSSGGSSSSESGRSQKQARSGAQRSRSPAHNQSGRGTSPRRKSIDRKRAESGGASVQKDATSDKEQQKRQTSGGQQLAASRTQFNILPPPQLAMATTGRGSMVSYAKSRIYDKPNKPILSNPPLVFNSISGATGCEWPSSLVFSVGDIPQTILSGRKPPKQVNVSKARKEWEGGEPFAKCRSRKRLAAAQRNKNKLLLHESWSMTSVVATQQLQLQQALAAANATHRSNIQQSDPSVKVLTRGSVLERVQQFERVPSAASLSSSCSSASSLLEDIDDEAVLTIAGDAGGTGNEPRPLSPGASKQAAYKYKVSTIQAQQQQQHSCAVEQQQQCPLKQQALARSVSSSGASEARERQRKLSFRRRSSINKSISSSSIPKFYHPLGTKPNTYEIELEKRNIVACFDRLPERKAQVVGPNSKRHFHSIALACGFSEYFKIPLLIYVKHQLDTKPELHDEAKLLARRRSSLLPLNPNNVPLAASPTTNGSGAASAPKRQLSRSSSQQMKPTTDNQNGSAPRADVVMQNSMNSLKKSASIDSNNQLYDAKNIQYVNCEQFLVIWKDLISCAYDTAARFTHLLTLGQRDFLLPDDFVPLVQSIIDDHPGLKFLRAAPDFHMRYIQTVIARIYYCINRSWTGKIKLQELRRSNFLAVLQVLSQEEDINQITDYFSYEHFYVIYCKFWSLDQDHDLLISKEDLARHNDASISSRIIERIFSGIVSRQIAKSGKMSYSDFVWFLIAEEDKKHQRSIEYWFRLMDLDGDGYISMYELEYFYYEQMKRLELMNIEALPFLDTACQILDLVNPKEKNKISLADLKRTRMATIFFDTFINLEKYLEHESREFVSTRDVVQDGVVISDWDRYASEEYENMVTEESSV